MRAISIAFSSALICVSVGLIVCSSSPAFAQPSTVSTAPVGFVTINIAAGTGTTKKSSLISIPLLGMDPTLPSSGTVALIKSPRTIGVDTSLGQGFDPGSLSQVHSPFLLQMTSGTAAGLMFLVSTATPNTASEITLTDPQDSGLNLTSAGVAVGDKFRLFPCDTLLSFFGTPSTTGIKGGATHQEADTILIINSGSPSTFFYNTVLGRWAKVALGSPDASHTPLLPYYGIQYSRLAATPLSLVSVGEVPQSKRRVKLRSNGSTLISSYWPASQSLRASALQNSPGWISSTNAQMADRLLMESSGSMVNYTHDGLNWRRVGIGRPIGDDVMINPASSVMINKKSTNSPFVYFEQPPPYSL